MKYLETHEETANIAGLMLKQKDNWTTKKARGGTERYPHTIH